MALLIALSLATALVQAPAAPPGATLSGLVVDDGSQKPIAGAQVMLMPSGRMVMPFRDRTRTATTDADGRYRFEGLESGEYRVTVQKAGFARLDGLDAPELTVTSGERREGFNFTLRRGAVIAGRVLDEAGEPIVDAQVMVLRKPPARLQPLAMGSDLRLIPAGQMTQTNDLGEFRVFGLLPHDEYYVRAMPRVDFEQSTEPRPTTLLATFFPGTVDPAGAQPISVGAGQTSGDVVIRMIAVPAFQVSGVVRDEAGRPVLNAMVRLMPDDTVARSMFHTPRWNQSKTDRSGRFAINGIINGTYTLLAIAPVVTSRAPQQSAGVTGGSNGSSFTFRGGMVGGTVGAGVSTEYADGVTTEYRDDNATRVPITINEASMTGLEIVVHRRRPGP
jgi:hypothetical protein